MSTNALLSLVLTCLLFQFTVTPLMGCCEDFDHPLMLEFMYTGGDCSLSTSVDPRFSCQDFSAENQHSQIYVKISGVNDPDHEAAIWKTTIVNLGSTFFFTHEDVGGDHIPEYTHLYIYSDPSESKLLQHIMIRSSCDEPMRLNEQWGPFRLTAMEGKAGGYCNAGSAALLPLSFVYFEALQSVSSVELKWGVSGELFEGLMEVQKSNDGRYFNPIATYEASGVSGVSEYSFTDIQPIQRENFYRLKIFNEDGSATYSQIELINYNHHGDELVFPNPAHSEINIIGLGINHRVEVRDLRGVIQKDVIYHADSNSANLSSLVPGVYFIIISGDMRRRVIQISKI